MQTIPNSVSGGKVSGLYDVETTSASMTGGLVTDEQAPAVLPSVAPIVTMALSLLAMLVRLSYDLHTTN